MTFHDELLAATAAERASLLQVPFIRDGAAGALRRQDYVAFLTQAYHHVKHTLPLIMACGAKLPPRLEWLRNAMAHYVEEETGHQEWILNDIRACGGDAEAARNGEPDLPAELLVAYAYDVIARVNPVGFLGMVLVLEGTSTAVASRAAQALAASLGLPREAFTYLSSHGALDLEHTRFFATLVDRLDDPADRALLIHCARLLPALCRRVSRARQRARRTSGREGGGMKLTGARILLTGASGGIGTNLALELARRGAALALLSRDVRRLHALAERVRALGVDCVALPFDLAAPSGHADVMERAAAALGGLDVLINNAGVQCFGALQDEDPAAIARLVAINVTAPLLLTRAALAHFRTAGAGHIVNVGSTFGAIAHPLFAAYSASKFALRGLSEALRRELRDCGITIVYVSPRATDTPMNSAGVREMQAMTGTRVDSPQAVAKAIVEALEQGSAERQLGWPERFLVRLNAVLPRLVDRALAPQARMTIPCARDSTQADRL